MNTILKTLFTFLAGAIIGSITALLTAPRSGKDTRKKIADDFNAQKEKLEEAATKKLEEAKEILNKGIENSQEASKKQIDKVAETLKVSDN